MSGVVQDFFVHGRGPQRQRCMACPGLRPQLEPWTFGRHDLDNPDVECTFLDVETINNICHNGSDDDLQEITMYKVDNAFNRIQMGQNAHGIFMCAVVEVMHGSS